jgi:hypothetical protein
MDLHRHHFAHNPGSHYCHPYPEIWQSNLRGSMFCWVCIQPLPTSFEIISCTKNIRIFLVTVNLSVLSHLFVRRWLCISAFVPVLTSKCSILIANIDAFKHLQ